MADSEYSRVLSVFSLKKIGLNSEKRLATVGRPKRAELPGVNMRIARVWVRVRVRRVEPFTQRRVG